MLTVVLAVGATSIATAAEVSLVPVGVAPGDLYLSDDFTDRGCATAGIISRYQPMLGYDATMAAQIDSYLGDDFSGRPNANALIASTYLPLTGYMTAAAKH